MTRRAGNTRYPGARVEKKACFPGDTRMTHATPAHPHATRVPIRYGVSHVFSKNKNLDKQGNK